MEYRRLIEIYDRLDATSSTLEKTDILADAFVDADELLPEFTQLARGRLFASWESDDLGVSSSLTAQAIANATGIDSDQIESWWRETGDLGDAAANAIKTVPRPPSSQRLSIFTLSTIPFAALPNTKGLGARNDASTTSRICSRTPNRTRPATSCEPSSARCD